MGKAYSILVGVVALGRAAPTSWRKQARALLFFTERPYFAAQGPEEPEGS
jgi:hypothetical protein